MENCGTEDDKDQLKIDSHSLISGEEYNSLYTALKEKYGKRIEAIWDDESTDPKKFVYEDVAIATYLIILWRQERISKEIEKLQSFVDFGCGNGLLVYILSEEGHTGYGIDVRKRKIWSKYNPQVDLREETWQPSDLFTDIDWIIGNHSDELSPWVPVVASKSSFNCRYFLLPCCAFEFSGVKFSKRVKDKSLYMSFMDYLIEVSTNVCGYQTKIDRLKIPSTKRICLIGDARSYVKEDFTKQCEKIDEFVKSSSDNKFAPRDKVELVKNCTAIDKSVIERIVKIIFERLLKNENLIDDWNIGGSIELQDAAKLISQDDLKVLKSEFGGLQTLFKNKQNIFEVKTGSVKLRKPKKFDEIKINANKKRKFNSKDFSCYFHLNHPQGCYLKEMDCIYKH
jgi:tRNASer (uridine44-2'-O)-methyltransferase